MNKISLRQWLNFLAVLGTIAINGLANALPLNGLTTGEISDRFAVYFVPAGYVFSIWGLIYLALLAFGIYQLLPSQRDNPNLVKIGYLFLGSSLANVAWLLFWHYELFPLTLVAMLSLLGFLIAIYLRLNVGRSMVSKADKWFVHIPFSIYLGWITVATIANITSFLYWINWSGWGISPEIWTVIMLTAAVVIATLISLTRGDIAYLLVLVWALSGIAIKHVDTSIVANSAWVATFLIFVLIGVAIIRNMRFQPSLVSAG